MRTENYNHGQKSLGHLSNVTNYPSVQTEITSFQHCMGGGG